MRIKKLIDLADYETAKVDGVEMEVHRHSETGDFVLVNRELEKIHPVTFGLLVMCNVFGVKKIERRTDENRN
jgi:limonene-1,2-epoxide hydrolase